MTRPLPTRWLARLRHPASRCSCPRPAAAQTCGDADGSGSVTVTDGVQTLRAAAGLSSQLHRGPLRRRRERRRHRHRRRQRAPQGRRALGAERVPRRRRQRRCRRSRSTRSSRSSPSASRSRERREPRGAAASRSRRVTVEDIGCPDGGVAHQTGVHRGRHSASSASTRAATAAPASGSFEFGQGLVINFFRAQVALSVLVTDLDSGRVVDVRRATSTSRRASGGGFVGNGQDIVITTPAGRLHARPRTQLDGR